MRGVEEKIRDTERLLAAAKKIRGDAALVSQLTVATGLSPEGVQKVLWEHMEVDTSHDDLERFVLKFADTSLVTVVLSANVFTGALRAIACARAKGERVVVRPSSRDPLFATELVRAANDPKIELVSRVEIREIDHGEIHVYGRDETIEKVKRAAKVPVHGHGHGLGVGYLTIRAEIDREVEKIADDIVVFDQRGCLSLRVLFVDGGEARAREVARSLHRTLSLSKIRRGPFTKEERVESVRFLDTMTMAGEVFEGASHVVALTDADASIVVPPSGRHVVVRPAVNQRQLTDPLEKISRFVCAFGTDDPERARSLAPSHARISSFGKMQKPKLDGHVDLRVK